MKLLITTIITMIATMSATAAFASDAGPYVSVGAGVFTVPDSKLYDPSGATGTSQQISYDTGYSVNGAVGYDFGINIRTEFEVAYRHADTNSLTPIAAGFHFESDISLVSLLANAFYDFKLPHGFTPYLGGGLGVAFVDIKQGDSIVIVNPVTGQFNTNNNNSSDTVFAYQVGAGITYALAPKVSLDAGYRYFSTSDINNNNVTKPNMPSNKQEFSSHIGQLAIRYKF